MKIHTLAGSTAVVALLSANAAFADVTPEEVWQNWYDMASSFGQTVTTEGIRRDGDALVVSGLAIEMKDKNDSVSTTIPELKFTDAKDGSVNITLSESYPLNFKSGAVGPDAAKDVAVIISAPGMVINASGTPAAVSYAVKAPSLMAKLDSIDGAPAADKGAMVEAEVTNMTANYLVEGTPEKKTLASQFGADAVSIKASGKDETSGSVFDMTGAIADLAGQSNGTLGASMMDEDLGPALQAGAAFGATLSHGAVSFDINADEGKGPTVISMKLGDGEMSMAMDKDRMRYGIAGSDTAFTMSGPDIPLPQLAFGYQEVGFNMDIPVAQSDTPADFSFLTKIVGLSVSEDIWSMIDMASLLPHDPATLIVDLKGKATVKGDIFADVGMDVTNGPPVDLAALDITQLLLSVAGAEFTGSGALTFDNTDMQSFDGIPAPTGKIDLKLTGGNTLLDKVVEMGLLSPDDVMGFRMMAAMVANSATDKDELTSQLEFKDKGFFANGQRLK